jgi:hypothetical protein
MMLFYRFKRTFSVWKTYNILMEYDKKKVCEA